MKGIPGVDALLLHRVLRKGIIDKAVIVLQGVFIFAMTIFVLFVGDQIKRLYDDQQTSKVKLAKTIDDTKRAIEQPVKPPSPPDYSQIARHNVFGAVGAQAKPTEAPATKSTLAMTLVGTYIMQGEEPYAIIEEQKKKTEDVFVKGDMIFGEAKLTGIFSDHVEISRNGKTETLVLDTGAPEKSSDSGSGIQNVSETEFVVDEAELDKALENLPLLLTQARAVPYFKDGRAVGLRLFAIKTGSLFEKIGLQNGDVLKSVNGNSLADLTQAMQLFQKLKEERSISVVMERNMAEKEMRYQIR